MQSYINIKSIQLALSQLVSKTSPLVGFKSEAYDWLVFEFEARRATIGGILISEGRRLVGFEFEATRATMAGIQISEGLRLVGFKIPLFVPQK
jgi:hypothetical protein